MVIHYTRPPLTDYQRAIIDDTARYTVTEASTKTGKTASHIVWLLESALRLKRNQSAWWVAPVYQQAEIAFKRMKAQMNVKDFFRANESKLLLTLPNGANIFFKSAEKPDNLYGDDVYACVFDEFTRAREEAWHALRSTLTATGGKCKFIGNVKGKNTWGYRLGVKARTGERDYSYHRITCWDAVDAGILSRAEIEQAQRDLPDYVFRELYLAEANDDKSNPFGLDHIAACLSALSTSPVRCYGIDLAKSVDWTVIVGLDDHGGICYFNRFQKDWMQTKAEIGRVVGRTPTLVDSTGVGDSIVEDLQRTLPHVEGFKYGQENKQKLMEGLASAIQQRRTTVLPGVHREELESFEFSYTASGVKYTAPSGVHDDTVNAHALAVRKYQTMIGNTLGRAHVMHKR